MHLHKQPKVRVWDPLRIKRAQLVDPNEGIMTGLSSRQRPSGLSWWKPSVHDRPGSLLILPSLWVVDTVCKLSIIHPHQNAREVRIGVIPIFHMKKLRHGELASLHFQQRGLGPVYAPCVLTFSPELGLCCLPSPFGEDWGTGV